jgi:hypothetical protein
VAAAAEQRRLSECESVRFMQVGRAGCARVRFSAYCRRTSANVVGFGDLRMMCVSACVESTSVVLVKGFVNVFVLLHNYLTLSHPPPRSFKERTSTPNSAHKILAAGRLR